MGLSASQGRMLLLTARKNDLELRAQQISQRRLLLSQQLESVANEYEDATSNRVMTISTRGTDASGSSTTKDFNLSYAALTSGLTKKAGTDVAGSISTGYGIVANEAANSFNSSGYSVTGFYRLADADGSIVVSNVNEIPGYSGATDISNGGDGSVLSFGYTGTKTVTYDKYTYDTSTYKNDKNDELLVGKMSSEELNKNTDNSSSKATNYVLSTSGKVIPWDGTGTDAAIAGTTIDENGNTIYQYYKVSGEQLADNIGSQIADMTKETGSYSEAVDNEATGTIKKGGDGKYTLYDSTGAVVARYVVDEALQGGGTSTTEEANYLQDCLRNGLYLIESGTADQDTNELEWKRVSYDSLSSVADTYYDADDAAAKAKYDRLQNQIQSQDKRLEMELDNIETQRSAVTTEVESVQQVIDDNIDSTFKTFA